MSDRYQKSERMMEEALRVIPLGSQTYSKSKTQFPVGAAPLYITHAQGSHVWDVDGNEYIDFANSLASVTLGYNDPDVTAAVKDQLEKGTIFSLPSPLEADVARQIIDFIPCAEMVRFGKNGSDATSGAVRLARAVTGRDHIAACGYHGWQDWYIGSTSMNRGVPESVSALCHLFAYNDLASLEKIFKDQAGQIAAVIMEPMNTAFPKPGFLEAVRDLAHQHGALLIFDETITGFRFDPGSAQALFNVTPDLATFGKGLANGYPVSALVGPERLMREMETIFFSFTFGGELLSLAAANATIKKLKAKPVLAGLKAQGEKVMSGIQKRIDQHGLGDVISCSGHPAWSFLTFKDRAPYTLWQIKTLFLQNVYAEGILTVGTHNISASHSDGDVQRLLSVYDNVFAGLAQAIREKTLEKQLRVEPLKPLFKVR